MQIPEINNFNVTSEAITLSLTERLTKDGFCPATEVQSKVAEWQSQGVYVVGMSGAFDIYTLNHYRALYQTRVIAAKYLQKSDEGYMNLQLEDLAASDKIRLVLSLDTNDAVAQNKSRNPEIGGSIRPIFDWVSRAYMLSTVAFAGRRYAVDFITKHGPSACEICPKGDCLHENATYNVASSGVNLVVLKSVTQKVTDLYPNTSFCEIDEKEGAFRDELSKAMISTTSIVMRTRQ